MPYPSLDHYEILNEIGRGAMGIVYRARNVALRKVVAIKALYPHLCGDEDFAARFGAEAEALARFTSPYIVQVYDLLRVDGQFFIVMEFVDAEALSVRLREHSPLDAQECVRIAEQLCLALEHAHSRGIIHRDIKPANILVAPDGQVKLVDFGIARSMDRKTVTSTFLGTPDYMSPEQIEGKPVDGRSDLYALGCVLYEMTSGEAPFEGGSAIVIAYHQVHDNPPPLDERTPRSLVRIISRCLQKAPDKRFRSAIELHRALQEKAIDASAVDETCPGTATPEHHKDEPEFDTEDELLIYTPPPFRPRIKKQEPEGDFLMYSAAEHSHWSDGTIRSGAATTGEAALPRTLTARAAAPSPVTAEPTSWPARPNAILPVVHSQAVRTSRARPDEKHSSMQAIVVVGTIFFGVPVIAFVLLIAIVWLFHPF